MTITPGERGPLGADQLLADIAGSGWDEDRAARFERKYGDDIRRLVVLYLWKLGLIAFRFDPRRAQRILQGQYLELFENTLSDVWIALTRSLAVDYIRELGARSPDSLPFLQYLAGTIRNLIVENARGLGLLPRESEGTLLRKFCASRRTGTQRAHLARALFQLQTKAERELLMSCPEEDADRVYRDLYRLVHHFFEQYIPTQCTKIQKLRGPTMVATLAEEYMAGEFRPGLEYTGAITPWDPGARRRVLGRGEDDETDEEGFLTLLALREEALRC